MAATPPEMDPGNPGGANAKMNWNLKRMVGTVVGFDGEDAGGVGAGAPAGGGGGAGASAGSGGGVFSAIPVIPLPAAGGEGGAAAGSEGAVVDAGADGAEAGAEGAGAATEAGKAGAAGPAGAGAAAVDPAIAPFHAPLLGRFKNWTEADTAIRRSQEEGVRLSRELRDAQARAQQEIAAREQKLETLKAEFEYVRQHGTFKEAAPEDLAKLRKEDPGAYADYILAKKEHDQESARAKNQRETETRNRQQYELQMRDNLDRIHRELKSDPEKFPLYSEMAAPQGPMEAILDMTRDGAVNPATGQRMTAISGHTWTHELLYLASLGKSYLALKAKGKTVQSEAERTARATAAASAAAAAGPAGGAHQAAGAGKAKTDQEKYEESVLKAGSQGVFGGG